MVNFSMITKASSGQLLDKRSHMPAFLNSVYPEIPSENYLGNMDKVRKQKS